MNEFVTYILYSPTSHRIYVGYTSDLVNRMASHNHFAKKGFTIRYRPWVVLAVEFHSTKQAALQRENYLKSGQGREWIYQTLRPTKG